MRSWEKRECMERPRCEVRDARTIGIRSRSCLAMTLGMNWVHLIGVGGTDRRWTYKGQ